jgi:hypothetical protein
VPDTLTEYYDLVKPEIEGSSDTWGEKLNADLDKIDKALRNCIVTSSPLEFNTPLTAQGTELPFYLPAQVAGSAPTHTQLAATQGWAESRILFYLNKFFPVNTIMLWWGGWGSVPAGWSFCDGTAGSPDLRDRFVMCAGNYLPPQQALGTPSSYPGEHSHANSYNTYPGPSGPQVLEVHNANAVYPGSAFSLPYCAVLYIRKYANW